MEWIKNYIRRFGAIFVFIVVAQLLFPDAGQITVVLFSLSVAAMVLLAAGLMLDDREGWGFFPYLNLRDLAEKAAADALGAAIVFGAVIYLLGTIIQVAVGR